LDWDETFGGPSAEAEQSLRDKVRALTRRCTTWRATGEVVREINQVTRGWGNYFALAHFHRSFMQMNHIVEHRLRQWLWRKRGSRIGKYEQWPNCALFKAYGLYEVPTKLA